MTGPLSPARRERPMVVRGAILMFGLIIAVSTIQRWAAMPEVQPGADAKPVPIWLHLIPLVLASSMIVQFPAKDRGSPLLMVSVGLIVASLLLLWLFSAGHLG